jgi:SAM-dependent methyltransferase
MNYFEQMAALAGEQGGYFYPWTSRLDGEDGEGAYTRLVEAHLTPAATVLEAGCGHGPDMLAFAPRVARYIAYDAVPEFIAIARAAADGASLNNVELLAVNSSARFNDGAPRTPAADGVVDLIISRRGPTNWIGDARRVCRPGARLIQINPLPAPAPDWNEALPPALRLAPDPANPIPEDLPGEIAASLSGVGLAIDEAWTFDVAETFDEPLQLYRALTWLGFGADKPSWEVARPALEPVFSERGPVSLRKRRYLWTAVVP